MDALAGHSPPCAGRLASALKLSALLSALLLALLLARLRAGPAPGGTTVQI